MNRYVNVETLEPGDVIESSYTDDGFNFVRRGDFRFVLVTEPVEITDADPEGPARPPHRTHRAAVREAQDSPPDTAPFQIVVLPGAWRLVGREP